MSRRKGRIPEFSFWTWDGGSLLGWGDTYQGVLGSRDIQSSHPQHSDSDYWYSCSSIWKEDCPPGSQCILRPPLSDLPTAHQQAAALRVLSLSTAKHLPFNQVTLGKTWDAISAEVCWRCSSTAASRASSICKHRCAGRRCWQTWRVAATGQAGHAGGLRLPIGSSGCADVSTLCGSAQPDRPA